MQYFHSPCRSRRVTIVSRPSHSVSPILVRFTTIFTSVSATYPRHILLSTLCQRQTAGVTTLLGFTAVSRSLHARHVTCVSRSLPKTFHKHCATIKVLSTSGIQPPHAFSIPCLFPNAVRARCTTIQRLVRVRTTPISSPVRAHSSTVSQNRLKFHVCLVTVSHPLPIRYSSDFVP